MAGTKSRRPTPEIVERWLKAGFGQGVGAVYKPFMYVRDVPSQGTSSMVHSRLTGRVHHYLSRQEFKVHLHAEYSKNVIDIREQFALLPRDETLDLAHELGIKHPKFPTTNTPTILTTDLLLSVNGDAAQEEIAISVKLKKDLTPRALEKLLIEKTYWNRRGCRWILATEDSISSIRVKNLAFFESSLADERVRESKISPAYFSACFERHVRPELSFNDIMLLAIREIGIDANTGHSLLGQAVWNHESLLNIDDIVLTHRSQVLLHRVNLRV
ncbi:transposase [Pseudomonas amygdali pv. morsprunorum]|nr:transposase [Pseudomonas amygdali pv. morsprunorum]PPS31478.1 transposase [Pseudomonas amygdali pv. morsprunorum]